MEEVTTIGAPLREATHPFRGEVVNLEDVDSVCEMYEMVIDELAQMSNFRDILKGALTLFATTDSKTRHIKGSRYTATLTMPSDSWEQKTLKELWETMPELSRQYLRIAKIDPQLREVDKLTRTSGDMDLERFKSALLAARQPSRGLPGVKVGLVTVK